MSRELIAAQSGWGKSWLAQQRVEEQIRESAVDHVVVMDHERELHGLVDSGLASWVGVGDQETGLSSAWWRAAIERESHLVVAKACGSDDWMATVGRVGDAAASVDGSVLIVVDEAHFVAPLRASVDDRVTGIATTGRGRGVSSLWITQRLAKLDTTVSSQCDRRLLGGFTGSADLDRVAKVVDYPAGVHNPQGTVRGAPDGVGDEPVRETGPGAEFVFSDRSGTRRRIDTSTMTMNSTHLGDPGSTLTTPG